MLIHHEIWLLKHPQRSVEWLRGRLLDGFEVHHLDGNHENNDPGNLVLVDGNDHQRTIHCSPWIRKLPLIDLAAKRQQILKLKKLVRGEVLYLNYGHGALSWPRLARDLGFLFENQPKKTAKNAAMMNGWEWPIRN